MRQEAEERLVVAASELVLQELDVPKVAAGDLPVHVVAHGGLFGDRLELREVTCPDADRCGSELGQGDFDLPPDVLVQGGDLVEDDEVEVSEASRWHVDLVGIARDAEGAVHRLYGDVLVQRHAHVVGVLQEGRGASDEHAPVVLGARQRALDEHFCLARARATRDEVVASVGIELVGVVLVQHRSHGGQELLLLRAPATVGESDRAFG